MLKSFGAAWGQHTWPCKKGDALTYFCQGCGKTLDKPPRRGKGGSEAPGGLEVGQRTRANNPAARRSCEGA